MTDPATARRSPGAATGALGRASEPAPAAAPAVPGPAVLGPAVLGPSAVGAAVAGPAVAGPAGAVVAPAQTTTASIAVPAAAPLADPAGDSVAAFTGATTSRPDLAARAAVRAERRPLHPVTFDSRVPRPIIGAAALLGAALAAVPFILAATQHDSRPRPRPADPAASYQQQVSPPGVVPSEAPGATP